MYERKKFREERRAGGEEVEREAEIRRSHRRLWRFSRSKRGRKRNTGKGIPINKAELFYEQYY